MRTTVAIADDLAEKLKKIAYQQNTSFTQALNEAVRRGLSASSPMTQPRAPFKAKTFSSALKAGVDPLRLNQLNDDLAIDGRR